MVKLTIDDRTVEAEEGWTVLDAAEKAGIHIPTLCHHESLSSAGACRVCAVEIFKDSKASISSACTYPVEEGLKVKTSSEKAIESRKLAVELLMAQHPHSETIKELAQKLGIESPRFVLKEKECILCELCVRACREIVGAEAITFIAQGKDRSNEEALIVHSEEKCIGCDSCAYICPTEAITVDDAGDTRTLSTPSGKLEFKLKQCSKCGKYWAPEKQLEYIIKNWDLEPELFDTCPDCRT